MKQIDIRDKQSISHTDLVSLNFIRKTSDLFFRRHYRQGLRSHIMEILRPQQLKLEQRGLVQNGVRRFPRAIPQKMLRIFRRRFTSFQCALKEIKRYQLLKAYLPCGSFAESDEFFVDYFLNGQKDVLLCGFQDYIAGKSLNPWDVTNIFELAGLREKDEAAQNRMIRRIRKYSEKFIASVKKMAEQTGFIPDLAGVGNLILTPSGVPVLVDINNISESAKGPGIPLDNKAYPAFDKSVEALSLLERKILNRSVDRNEPLYRTYLDPGRMKEVRELERRFYLSLRDRD